MSKRNLPHQPLAPTANRSASLPARGEQMTDMEGKPVTLFGRPVVYDDASMDDTPEGQILYVGIAETLGEGDNVREQPTPPSPWQVVSGGPAPGGQAQ